jgi:hypothetical protein
VWKQQGTHSCTASAKCACGYAHTALKQRGCCSNHSAPRCVLAMGSKKRTTGGGQNRQGTPAVHTPSAVSLHPKSAAGGAQSASTSGGYLRAAVAGHLVAVLLAVVHVQYAPLCGATAYEATRVGPWRTCRSVLSHACMIAFLAQHVKLMRVHVVV